MARHQGGTGKTQGDRSRDLPGRMRRFGRNEDGTLVIFALMMALLMIMMGGIAVDVMRYEARRTSLQNTLDRSTLAAASLTQDLIPKDVVDDYFLRAGQSQFLKSVTVTEGLNFRNVSADALADAQPLFLQMLGIDEFDVITASTAEQRITNVEIMLVLDVSGSMNSNSKIANLKSAAKSFVSTVLANDVEDKISIGIVPFNGQVNLGPTVRGYFTMTDLNGLPTDVSGMQAGVDCVDLPQSAYDSYAVSQTDPLSMTSNVDTYSSGSSAPAEVNKWCPVTNTSTGIYYTGNPAGSGGNIVRLPQQDVATLQGYIDGLTAVGATSINAGMKWGMTLLDPSVQNIYTAEMAAGRMPATMATRPLAYDAEEAMKVIVLMTDGENFPEERVNSSGTISGTTYNFKTGLSPIYKSDSDGKYSIFLPSRALPNQYYVVTTGSWQLLPWTNSTNTGTATQLTWPQVWSSLRLQYVAQSFFATPLNLSYSTVLGIMRTKTDTTTSNTPVMDGQLQTACSQAKDAGVIIYGIAFEAPTGGQTQIRNCATSAANYFNASGMEISTAFAAIANNISQLRLTQ